MVLVQGRFNCFHFSFKSKELSKKNSSISKVKADGWWEEREIDLW
jgi:hypothetical protein